MHDPQHSWHIIPVKRRHPFAWIHTKGCHIAVVVSLLMFILTSVMAYRYILKQDHHLAMAEPINTLLTQYTMLLSAPISHRDNTHIQHLLNILGKQEGVEDAAIYDTSGSLIAAVHPSWSLLAQTHPTSAYISPIRDEQDQTIGVLRIATNTNHQLTGFYQQKTLWSNLIIAITLFSLFYGALLVLGIKRYGPLIPYLKQSIWAYLRR
ncbi:AhpA/YtjB family protein [Alteromonas sp. C1M14]|uniref:AhpA/YtjB family protein n=1 Tax=Alteromonas sp. C1M14 TaxID=2841567 RepID=UPI001C093298|nr:AhpA/YtjB family protein [Alteromonas sp. C1M14]MBU2979076.1 hypothetical protein [Alteromonas sp. C1M14]